MVSGVDLHSWQLFSKRLDTDRWELSEQPAATVTERIYDVALGYDTP